MSSTETTSTATQLVATNNARVISIWWFLSPFKDFTAKIAQTLGLEYGTHLSANDQATIDQYYKSRRQITIIMPEVTQQPNSISSISAANDEEYMKKKNA